MSCEVLDDELGILSTWLRIVSIIRCKRDVQGLTTTIPLPQRPAHCPATKLIQFLCPNMPGPTEILGFSFTLMRKSSSSAGVGIWSERAISPSSNLCKRLLAGMDSFMTFR